MAKLSHSKLMDDINAGRLAVQQIKKKFDIRYSQGKTNESEYDLRKVIVLGF